MRNLLAASLCAAACLVAQDTAISPQRIREHTRYLSSDAMEGRGVGTRGEALATDYIAQQFALAGAKPAGDDGTYFQKVPLVGLETRSASTLSASAHGTSNDFHLGDDFVGFDMAQRTDSQFDGDVVEAFLRILAREGELRQAA